MVKPMLIPTIPPVTGVGRPSSVVANLFDSSGSFRQRNNSFKRPRRDDGQDDSRDRQYDLTRDFPPLSLPGPLKLDVAKIKGLLVKATEAAHPVRARMDDGSVSAESRELATASIALMEVLGAVVEAAIIPMAGLLGNAGPPVSAAAESSASRARVPVSTPGLDELKAALASADKTAVVFDADLGQSRVANRATLNAAFTSGIRTATLKSAADSGGEPSEAVRLVNDALSCADNLDFLGEASSKKVDKRDPANPVFGNFFTMPIRVDFPDKHTRINFERVMRKHCGLRVTMSLPPSIRRYQGLFLKAMKERYSDRVVMARTDVSSMSLIAFQKSEGDARWTRCPESVAIPTGILLADFVMPGSVILPAPVSAAHDGSGAAAGAAGGGDCDMGPHD
jgi:hypothetical protein